MELLSGCLEDRDREDQDAAAAESARRRGVSGGAGRKPVRESDRDVLVAEDPVSGTLVELAGKVTLDGATGQIEATFENSPQLPFEDAELHFFGGERAPLATPAHCGSIRLTASFTPWSGNEAGDVVLERSKSRRVRTAAPVPAPACRSLRR